LIAFIPLELAQFDPLDTGLEEIGVIVGIFSRNQDDVDIRSIGSLEVSQPQNELAVSLLIDCGPTRGAVYLAVKGTGFERPRAIFVFLPVCAASGSCNRSATTNAPNAAFMVRSCMFSGSFMCEQESNRRSRWKISRNQRLCPFVSRL
jgi:hypothetical protein